MPDWKTEGLKAASDTAKQIVTLSTGVITLTVTLLNFLVPAPAGNAARVIPQELKVGWILLVLSLLAALWTLMAITGTLDSIDDFTNGATTTPPAGGVAYRSNIVAPALAMIATFVVAIVLIIFAVF